MEDIKQKYDFFFFFFFFAIFRLEYNYNNFSKFILYENEITYYPYLN